MYINHYEYLFIIFIPFESREFCNKFRAMQRHLSAKFPPSSCTRDIPCDTCHSPRKWPHNSTKKVPMTYAANIRAVSSGLIPSEATFAMFITMLVFYFFWKSNREAASWVFIRVVGIHKPAFYLLLENQEWEGQAIGRNCILCYDGSRQYNKMIVGGRQNRRILNQCY